MGATLRAGLLGLGEMGRHHARVLRTLDGIDFVGAADPRGDTHGAASSVPVYATVDELLHQRLDICVVALPTDEHEDAALALAAAGVHALIEKPLASTTASAERIAAAFEQAQLVGCVGHIERYNPSLLEMRDRLDRDQLGQMYQIASRRQGPFPGRIKDVGVVKDLATHDLDLTMWVARSPFAGVSARTAHRTGRPFEDLVAIVGSLENGIVTSHLVNWLTPLKDRKIIATGERGCFEADTLTGDLTFYANSSVPTEWDAVSRFRGVAEGDMVRYALAKREPLLVELMSFRDAVLGVDDNIVTLREGAVTVAVAEAVLSSAETGSVVDVNLPLARGATTQQGPR
jgi:UDP-N-acetylglucosamine 3-dehydrogenase